MSMFKCINIPLDMRDMDSSEHDVTPTGHSKKPLGEIAKKPKSKQKIRKIKVIKKPKQKYYAPVVVNHQKQPKDDVSTDDVSSSNVEKMNVIIQMGDDTEIKMRIPKKTNLGDLQNYLRKRFGDIGNFLVVKGEPINREKNPTKIKLNNDNKVNIVFKPSVGGEKENVKLRVPRGVKIQDLKEGLAKKFGFEPEDFDLVHMKDKKPK